MYAAEINYGQYSYNGRLYAVQYGADVQLERQLYWELKYSGNRRNTITSKDVYTEFNTFSRTYSGLCAGDVFCQYNDDEQSARGMQWAMCDKCLQWFHAQCVTYGEEAFLKEWFCGCHIPEMEIG